MDIIHQQYVIISLMALIYIVLVFLVSRKFKNDNSERKNLLWKLVVVDGALVIGMLFSLSVFLPQDILTTVSWIGYSFIIPYVFAIEIAGYIKISKFDDKKLDILKSIRKKLVKTSYSLKEIKKLKVEVEDNKMFLSKQQIEDLLCDYIEECERTGNFDKFLWELSLTEITSSIGRISNRSKHPFPKLIDVLSLAGMSFLIAQIIDFLF